MTECDSEMNRGFWPILHDQQYPLIFLFYFSERAGENLRIIAQSFMSFSFIDNMPEFECLATTFSEPQLNIYIYQNK